ncbi:hypothetical protein NE857_01365 [Nocardiopsis exhalans]|uniref:Uncharacterized protein n=1 Tax=Nocardiopsis exhalans TaxID=163604 RepID=A0ABY5D7J5_9ACTN|nr:hypothetical protein [Nocardiopsis exhalans]USY20341.1 hypothetical protein NE857_01365 [Nocardiopsis exhalans]
MFDNTRTSARTLLIAATTAGFVALGGGLASADTLDRVANPGTVNKVANPGTVNKITAPGAADPDVSAPQVELPEAPEVTAPDTNDVADSAQEQVDSVDATVPQVNAPEPSTDEYTAAARGVTHSVLYAVTVARGDAEAVAFEAASVTGQVLDGVDTDTDTDTDLEVVDALPETDGLAELPEAADVEGATEAVELPEAPGVEEVEDVVGGAAPSDLADPEAVDTGLVGAEAPDTDLPGGLL